MPPEKGNLCSHGNIGACIVGIGFFFFFGGGGVYYTIVSIRRNPNKHNMWNSFFLGEGGGIWHYNNHMKESPKNNRGN